MRERKYRQSEEYAELAWEVIRERDDLRWIEQTEITIGFLTSDEEKKRSGKVILGECRLVKSLYRDFVPYDYMIIIYEPNVARLTRDQMKILLYHELLHIDVREKDGEPIYKIRPHDVEEFREIVDQFGLDWAR